jgi:hypothetical protein
MLMMPMRKMPSGRIRTGGHRAIVTLAVSAAALWVGCGRSFADDQVKTVLAHASSGPLQCEIRTNEAGGSVELSGMVASSRALAGNYRFNVTKSGHSGSSNIHQGNKFILAADKESRVGQVTINLEPDADAVVELIVGSDDGIDCVAKAPIKR